MNERSRRFEAMRRLATDGSEGDPTPALGMFCLIVLAALALVLVIGGVALNLLRAALP